MNAWNRRASDVRRVGGARRFAARVCLSGTGSEEPDLGVEGESTQVVRSGFTATSHVLNYINRPVRTRMPGGVGGVRSIRIGPYPDFTVDRSPTVSVVLRPTSKVTSLFEAKSALVDQDT